MLGRKERGQLELFITGSLRQLVPEVHILARVDQVLDLSWLRDEVYLSFNMSDLNVFSERLLYLNSLQSCVEMTLEALDQCRSMVLPIVEGKIRDAEAKLLCAITG
jgi:hypothetical protein